MLCFRLCMQAQPADSTEAKLGPNPFTAIVMGNTFRLCLSLRR